LIASLELLLGYDLVAINIRVYIGVLLRLAIIVGHVLRLAISYSDWRLGHFDFLAIIMLPLGYLLGYDLLRYDLLGHVWLAIIILPVGHDLLGYDLGYDIGATLRLIVVTLAWLAITIRVSRRWFIRHGGRGKKNGKTDEHGTSFK
jgi:hypothetical protein